jgi:hypothetical protein
MISRNRSRSGRRQIEKFDETDQLGRHFNGGRREHQSAPVSGELLPYIPQPAHHDRVVHVAMEVFQDEDSFDAHALEIRQRLNRVGGVIHGTLGAGSAIGATRRRYRSR